jgi:hypothetical protein
MAALLDADELPLYARFRLAVTLELCGHRQRAIAMLERALGGGFSPAEIDNDPDLRTLRADPVYLRMIQRRGAASIIRAAPSRSGSPGPR